MSVRPVRPARPPVRSVGRTGRFRGRGSAEFVVFLFCCFPSFPLLCSFSSFLVVLLSSPPWVCSPFTLFLCSVLFLFSSRFVSQWASTGFASGVGIFLFLVLFLLSSLFVAQWISTGFANCGVRLFFFLVLFLLLFSFCFPMGRKCELIRPATRILTSCRVAFIAVVGVQSSYRSLTGPGPMKRFSLKRVSWKSYLSKA